MGWKEGLWMVLFVFAWFPVGMLLATTAFDLTETYPQDFGIYNEDWNGLSGFREQTEAQGYETYSIQSSMSVITRYEGDAVLVIMGPVRDFSVDAVLVVFDHLMAGGSILIADDFGTANNSFMLLNTLISQAWGGSSPFPVSGVLSFTGGVLLDLDSYDKSPKLPVITDLRAGLDGGALTQGVNSLHLNWATALSPRSALGLAGIAWTTERTWCETEIEKEDPWPSEGEWNGSLPVVGAIDLGFGGASSETGRIVAVSDPSMFTNDMMGLWPDNARFAANTIRWLSQGNSSLPIVFCEHLLEVPPNSAEFFYGLYLARAFWLSTMPYFSALYPFVTAVGIRKYLPDMKKPEVKAVSEVFMRRGQTYFSERMSYYRREGNYARVVKMIYRKLRRDIMKKNMWTKYDPHQVWELMKYKDPKLKQERFFQTIERIEEISSSPKMKISENEMMDLFFFVRNIESKLINAKR
jgi:hypothetical protein